MNNDIFFLSMGHSRVAPNPLFQSEAKWEAIDMKMILYFHANKTHYNKKGFTLSLVLKLGEFCRTREWPISSCARTVM